MEDLKEIIANNLVKFRKHSKLTQLELADKLKYSDKNISKWERGESVPDVVVLKQLADLYEVKVDDFFINNLEIKENKNEPSIKEKNKVMSKKQILILLLSISLVWLTAMVIFSVLINVGYSQFRAWLVFIYAVTLSCIVAVIFTSIWCTNLLNAITVSLLIWSTGVSAFLTINSYEAWVIFLICVPVQILDILWFSLKKLNKNLIYNKQKTEKKKEVKQEKIRKKLEKKKLKLENKQKVKENKKTKTI